MKRILSELALIFGFYIMQVTLCDFIRIGGIMPNVMILLPVFFGLLHGKRTGMFVGFVSGFFYDLFFTEILGFSMLIFTIIGYVCGMLFNQYEEKKITMPLIMVVISTFVFEFLNYVAHYMLRNRIITGYYVGRIIIPIVIYTAILAIALYWLIVILNRAMDKKEKPSGSILDEGRGKASGKNEENLL